MKNYVVPLVFFIILLVQNVSYSQVETAVSFLQLPISPSLNGMGVTGTSLPTDDPFGFLYNPAQLGYISQSNNLSFIFYPSSVDWIFGLSINGMAFNLGYNFKNLIDFPLSVGIGYANQELNYGEFIRTGVGDPRPIGIFEAKDYYYAYSIGAGIDYYVQFYAGITYKNITSILSDQPTGEEQGSGTAEANTIDYGFLLNVPVLKLIDDNFSFKLIEDIPAVPFFNFSLGYTQLNIGDEIYYIDPAQAEPLPRTARLGYGISTGLDFQIQDITLRVFEIGFTVDAEDLLILSSVDTISGRKIDYQSFLGDINIGRNIIQIKGDENVVSRAGLQISLLETLVIRNGHFSGRRFQERTTNGIEIRAKGLLKLLNKFTSDPTMEFISDHFDIRYYNSSYNIIQSAETNYEGITLVINGFEFW